MNLTATRRASLHKYTFSPNDHGTLPCINVDITNDGQESSQGPTILIDPPTGRVTGTWSYVADLNATLLTGANNVEGGSNFQASFGPGRYNAFTCVDFRIVSPGSSPQAVIPVEYGVWSSSGPVRGTVTDAGVLTSNHYRLQIAQDAIHLRPY